MNTIAERNSIFLVYELSKYYGNFPGVKEISFSVKRSECFGLIGVNGAGKSTTFRMLTGEEFPNSGVMYLNGKEISANRKKVPSLPLRIFSLLKNPKLILNTKFLF